MAWPHSDWNAFWQAAYGPDVHNPTGEGVDHAPPPPPPPEFSPFFMGRGSWGPWGRNRGWEAFAGRPEDFRPHHHHSGPHARARGHWHGHGRGRNQPEEGTAEAAELNEKRGVADKEPIPDDATMRDEIEDPPEEAPEDGLSAPEDHGSPRRRGGRHHRRGGRGGFERAAGGHGGRYGYRGPRHDAEGFERMGGLGMGGGRGGRWWRHHGPRPHEATFCGPRGFGVHPNFEAAFGGPRGFDVRGPHQRRRGGRHGPPAGPFDFREMINAFASHPYAQQVREFLDQAQQQNNNNDENNNDENTTAYDRAMTPDSSVADDMAEGSFTPPMDLFEQENKWILHLAVPGAKKADIGINWDADRSVLSIGGVIHRPGDEEFLQGLMTSERSVGLFSREVRLPPLEEGNSSQRSKEEVDSEGIEAKMEDGILFITVPKVAKDWTEVKRVEIV